MNKKTAKKFVGSFVASLFLTTGSSTLIGAHTQAATENQNPMMKDVFSPQVSEDPKKNESTLQDIHTQLDSTILQKVHQLIDQGINLKQIQNELHNTLNNLNTNNQ
jgi:hypothetical protein